MEKSESIKNLVVALLKAQADVKLVEKEANNPFFKSKYADLPAIDKEYKRVFLKHGLVVTQLIEGMGMITVLAHESGEYMLSTATLNPTKNDPQGLGSAITYMRRYALAAICGIVSSEDDDDGNHASQPAKVESKAAPAAAPSVKQRVIGKPSSPEEAGNGFVKYVINDIELTTKKGELIDVMAEAYSNGVEVQVYYTEQTKGRFTNRYIDSVEVCPKVPF